MASTKGLYKGQRCSIYDSWNLKYLCIPTKNSTNMLIFLKWLNGQEKNMTIAAAVDVDLPVINHEKHVLIVVFQQNRNKDHTFLLLQILKNT